MLAMSVSPTATAKSLPETPSLFELELLAKLEEQNRLIEVDTKNAVRRGSLKSRASHSRQNSQTSFSNHSSGSDVSEESCAQWSQVVQDWDYYTKKRNNVIKEMIRAEGVPMPFRCQVWQLLSGAYRSALHEEYEELLRETSPCEKAIRRDIARTFPSHDYFKEDVGQESLFNVVKAYSLLDREVGYCQGSGFIAGLLLTVMPEVDAFCVLTKLMQDYGMRELFKPNMAHLGLCMFQLECLIQDEMPDIHMHFQSQSLWTSTYASSWFLTLFSTSLSMDLACWVMDLFLCEGMEIIFKLAMAIIENSKSHLLSLDMEGMLRYLQKDFPEQLHVNPVPILSLAYKMKLNTKKMKKMEKEYMALKSKEQEDMVELRRLRTENNLLDRESPSSSRRAPI